MKYFVEFVVSALVDYKDEVDVQEQVDGRNISLVVRTNPSDIGKVIGKNGRTISAIRSLLSAAASRQDKRVTFEVEDDNPPDMP